MVSMALPVPMVIPVPVRNPVPVADDLAEVSARFGAALRQAAASGSPPR